MFALRPYRKVRKRLRALTRIPAPECEQAVFLRRLIAQTGGDNVVRLRPSLAEESRQRLIEAGKAHCVATCGGCALTAGFVPPA